MVNKYRLSAERPYIRGGIDTTGRRLSIYDSTARDLFDSIIMGYLPEVGQHPHLLLQLVRPNLNHLCIGTLNAVPPPPAALRAS